MNPETKNTTIAKLGKSHGVRGWMRLHPYTRDPQDAIDYAEFWLLQNPRTKKLQPVKLEQYRLQGQQLLIKIEGCETPEAASELANWLISTPTSSLKRLDDGEYYWQQLIGLEVYNTNQISLGKVDHIMETGANDVLVVKSDRERLIPYSDTCIIEIQLDNGILIVDWDESF